MQTKCHAVPYTENFMKALIEAIKPADPAYALVHAIDAGSLPAHIAIIMDGNGRWAKRRHMPRVAGHRAGVDAVRSTVETAARIHIPALTLYAFSEENWKKRPKSEVDF